MAEAKRTSGPPMDWLSAQNKELADLFATEFFKSNRRMKSAFRRGDYRASPQVALRMVKWWASFGVQIRLSDIRPDAYGEKDVGPSVQHSA